MKVQSVLIPKRRYSLPGAVRWLRKHKFKFIKVHETRKYFRFRQRRPKRDSEYITKKLPNGVRLVIENV